MSYIHAIVWLDHLRARVIRFSAGPAETVEISSAREDRKVHRKSGIPGSGHAADDHDFFDAIAALVANDTEVLISGPGTAKTAFVRYTEARHPDVAARIVGVETMDHPSDEELLAIGRTFFKRVDQLGR